jgi:hypothetical protein
MPCEAAGIAVRCASGRTRANSSVITPTTGGLTSPPTRTVGTANDRAELPYERIVKAMHVAADDLGQGGRQGIS